MDSWTGHQSITSTALLNLFGRAAKGDAVFTPGERTLVTLSEFWAAARTGSLLDFLERDTASRLVIEWPSGAVQEFKNVRAGSYQCTEGQGLTAG